MRMQLRWQVKWSEYFIYSLTVEKLNISQYNNQGQTTAPATSCPTLYDKRVGSFTSPANHFNTEDAGDGACGLYSVSERRESLTNCWRNYKGSTFSSVILRPWVLVRPESNSRPPAWQADAQPTEPPVLHYFSYPLGSTVRRIASNSGSSSPSSTMDKSYPRERRHDLNSWWSK